MKDVGKFKLGGSLMKVADSEVIAPDRTVKPYVSLNLYKVITLLYKITVFPKLKVLVLARGTSLLRVVYLSLIHI